MKLFKKAHILQKTLRITWAVVLCLSMFRVATAVPAKADVSPPMDAPVGTLGPYQYQDTQVQILSERVEMELQVLSNSQTQVAVKASFLMRNQGSQDESMQAIFPLTGIYSCVTQDYYYVTDESSFMAKIDGTDTPTSTMTTPSQVGKYCEPVSWATFPVTFPVGKDVSVVVAYNMLRGRPEAWELFDYTLSTGAAWYGPIGRAEVVARLPYLVTSENVHLSQGATVTGREIHWVWSQFEPGQADDLYVRVVNLWTWNQIQAYKADVRQHPDSADSWTKLASAYYDASVYHFTWVDDWTFARHANDAYQQAIALQPDSASLRLGYANLLFAMAMTGNNSRLQMWYPSVQLVVRQIDAALAIDPNNQEAKDLLDFVKMYTDPENWPGG